MNIINYLQLITFETNSIFLLEYGNAAGIDADVQLVEFVDNVLDEIVEEFSWFPKTAQLENCGQSRILKNKNLFFILLIKIWRN